MVTLEILIIFSLSFAQQVVGAMGSRARNRNNHLYHASCAFVSHTFFILTMLGIFKLFDFTYWFAALYVFGATIGNLFGALLSMSIEKRFNIHV